MTALEIALLFVGAVIFLVSFIIPVKKKEASGEIKEMIEDEVKLKVKTEIEELRSHIDDVVDEAIDYAQEKTERSLERISNEKIMAVNEYSDTVLEEINKNHKEVMFLYDMLNDKHEDLKSAVSEATVAAKNAKENAAQAANAAEAAHESTKEAEAAVTSFKSLAPESITTSAASIPPVPVFHSAPASVAQVNAVPASVSSATASIGSSAAADEQKQNAAAAVPQSKTVAPQSDPQKEAKSGEPTFRTLKWAEFALEQADEAYENETLLNDQVIALHKLGKSDVDIARELNIGVGEVSLIIGLHAK